MKAKCLVFIFTTVIFLISCNSKQDVKQEIVEGSADSYEPPAMVESAKFTPPIVSEDEDVDQSKL